MRQTQKGSSRIWYWLYFANGPAAAFLQVVLLHLLWHGDEAEKIADL